MADTLLKTVRITDDIKLEVYQQGSKRKYALFSDSYQTKTDKYDISMSDDDVIKEALITYNARYGSYNKKYDIIQTPYKDPLPKRTYGNGDKSPYYLNNGCAINIQWIGDVPNPEFNPGTYSNLESAEDAGKPRYLKKETITSSIDEADNSENLKKSSWTVSPPITDGINEPKEVKPDYRDLSVVYNKIVTVTLPSGFKENGGKGYLVWTNHGLQYDSKSLPSGTTYQETILIDGKPVIVNSDGDIIEYFDSDIKDKDIVEKVIQSFKSDVGLLNGMSINDYDLKLCAPDTEACSLIEYKSPLEAPNKTPEQAAVADTPPVSTKPISKLKFNIEGLPDVIEVKAKEDLPTFTIWAGEIPKPISEQIDSFEDLSELNAEYTENNAVITEEQQLKLDLTVYLDQGDSEGTEDDDPGTTTTTGSGVKTNGTNAGGSGDRRFQQQLTIRGRVVKNGEIPKDLLAKVDFGGYLLEKHAAVKFSALNKAFKEKFGKNFTISGPYRTIDVSINIFDWAYFNKTGLARKIGTNGGTAAAKPGTSKHGWGQAMDIDFKEKNLPTPGPGNKYFDWMEQNARKYGWINPAWAKKSGAGHEPWHWEYIGDDLFAA